NEARRARAHDERLAALAPRRSRRRVRLRRSARVHDCQRSARSSVRARRAFAGNARPGRALNVSLASFGWEVTMKWASGLSSIVRGGVAGCSGAPLPKTPGGGGPPWQEITSEHFVIDTNLEPEVAKATARQLENLRKAMIEVVFPREPLPPPPLRVLALRS